MIIDLPGGLKFHLDKKYQESVSDFLESELLALPDELPYLKIWEHAEAKRVLPPGTPRPGPMEIKAFTNYMTEILECMSSMSSIQHVAIMKSAQMGFTAMMECILCYYMDHDPSDILFISATAELLHRWSSRRLEPAIDSYGLRDKIYAQKTENDNKSGRRTSTDKTLSKEYNGCRLDMASAQSPSALRSMDKRILLRDEIDGYPLELKNEEGNALKVSFVRTNSHADRRKVCDISTPTTYERSEIYKEYLQGDQRRYLVSCPHCKGEQFLEFEFDAKRSGYGLKPIYDEDNILVDAVYECAICHQDIHNHHKTEMLANGYWKATAKSSSQFFRSYQISSLYAPVGMIEWREIWKEYQDAKELPNGMRSFTNLYGGLPFRETGARPKVEALNELAGNYSVGEVPDGVLYLTAAADVQAGADKWRKLTPDELDKEIKKAKKEGRKEKFPRVELEVLGHGIGYRTWSIEYKVFEGAINNIHKGVWKQILDYYKELAKDSKTIIDGSAEPVFRRSDGREFPIVITGIDAHDYSNSNAYVTAFCEQFGNFYPILGFDVLKQRKDEKRDEMTRNNLRRYRLQRNGEDSYLIQVSTNYYKTQIYNRFNLKRNDVSGNPPGWMDHPKEYGKEYFTMLSAEEKLKDGSFRHTGGANEALDVKIYNLCVASVHLDLVVKDTRAAWIRRGLSAREAEERITHLSYLKELEENTKRKH